MIVVLIATLHIGCFIFVLVQLKSNHLFVRDPSKTIILLWVQISIVTVPCKILYFLFTIKTLLMNRRMKQQNLNNPDIKEAICEGAGLQEQMDQFLTEKLQLIDKT